MRKIYALLVAGALALSSLSVVAAPANAAPQSASQAAAIAAYDASLPRVASVQEGIRFGFLGFAVDGPRCYAAKDVSKSMIASSIWVSSGTSVKLDHIAVVFSNGSTIADWASSLTVADRTGSINFSSSTYNPGSTSLWYPTNPPWTGRGLRNAYARASSTAAGDCFPSPMYP